MITIPGVIYSRFKSQGVINHLDNSHFQCIASAIGIGYQTMLWKVIQS